MLRFIGLIVIVSLTSSSLLAQVEWDSIQESELVLEDVELYCNLAGADATFDRIMATKKTAARSPDYDELFKLGAADCLNRNRVISEALEEAKSKPTREEFYKILLEPVTELDSVSRECLARMTEISDNMKDVEMQEYFNEKIAKLNYQLGYNLAFINEVFNSEKQVEGF